MARHHSPEEQVQLLAQLMLSWDQMEKDERLAFYRKNAMSESTYFCWKRKYVQNEQERELILQARNADLIGCRSIIRKLNNLRNPPKKTPFMGFESRQDFLRKHQIHEPDEDGYWMPHSHLDKEGQAIWAEWEALEYEEMRRWHETEEAPRLKKIEADEKKYRALKQKQPPIKYDSDHRYDGRYRVRVYGRLPRGDHTSITLNLPADLHWRLTKDVDGSMNQCIPALLRYALDTLDARNVMLHVYDGNKETPVFGY